MTKDHQIQKVTAGIALGVLAVGAEAVTGNKSALEFAFNYAWRRWECSALFPSIGGHDPGNMFWLEMGRSERRRGGYAAWDSGRWATPYVKMTSWTVGDALEEHADAEVSEQQWAELGRLFLEYFKDSEVRHS